MMTLREAMPRDLPRLYELWLSSYPNDADYRSFYFNSWFANHPDCAVVLEQDGRVQSAGYWFDGGLFTGEEFLPVRLLYAAATDPAARRCGYNTRLTEYLIEKSRASGICLLVMNALETTRGILESLGAKPSFRFCETRGSLLRDLPDIGVSDCAFPDFRAMRAFACDALPGTVRWDEETLLYMYRDVRIDGKVIEFYAGGARRYACVTAGEECLIRETNCPPDCFLALLGAVHASFPESAAYCLRAREGTPCPDPACRAFSPHAYAAHALSLTPHSALERIVHPYMNLTAD